jgi:hypothetical protein
MIWYTCLNDYNNISTLFTAALQKGKKLGRAADTLRR